MQITKYRWENWEPTLILRDNDYMSKIRLINQKINFRIGKKMCIGFYKNGKHNPCPKSREILTDWFCRDCIKKDDFFLCVKCDGSDCINEKQRGSCKENNYFIYLAAFDNILKVGISYEFRFLERLVEQGADLAAKIVFLKDGKKARQMEQEIKQQLNVVDRIRGFQKHEILFGDPNKCAVNIMNALSKLEKNGFDIKDTEIYDLRNYYRLGNILSKPQKIEIKENTELKGEVVSAKGNIIVFRNEESFFSINSHDIIGRVVENLN